MTIAIPQRRILRPRFSIPNINLARFKRLGDPSFNRIGIRGQPWGWGRSGGVSDPLAAFLVFDSFTDADGTTLPAHTPDKDTVGGGWTDVIAGITIESNKASDNDVRVSSVIDAGNADIIIEAVMVIQGGGNGFNGFTFRWQDAANFFIGGCDVLLNRITIWRVLAGVFVEQTGNAPGSFPLAPGETRTIRIEMSGTAIEIFIDGGSEGAIVNANFQTETEHGLYNDSIGGGADATWDTFTIQPN